ncbi:hypothetical protein V8E54_003316 [Elaphomyces granulatus]
MPMQSTPWCLVMALQLAEHTEGTRRDRAFSVVQSAGKEYTVGQPTGSFSEKDHGFNQKWEAIDNSPNGRHPYNYHHYQQKIPLYQKE